MDSVRKKLVNGLLAMRIHADEAALQKLLDYLLLLEKWNRIYNLTAVRDVSDMVTLHVLDSLSILRYVESNRLLDVGSGAGFPGIPLAVIRPELQVVLLDANHKKAGFLRHAKTALVLPNVEVVCERVEQYQPEKMFTEIVSRAFSDLAEFFHLTSHLVAPQGRWLAMKGVYPHDELMQLHGEISAEVNELQVPGLEAARHLVVLERTGREEAI